MSMTTEIDIPGNMRQILHEDPLYISLDKEVANAAWDNYTINGYVALPTSWAIDRGWKTGLQMPGDPSKSMFVIDAFHQIHCLMLIRKMGTDLLEGKPPSGLSHTTRHINHCYDTLRQGITCRAHSVPLYVPEDGEALLPGVGQQRECRDWDALQRWVLDHTACYNGVKCPSMYSYING
ncbi:hypothetical protein B0O99DRAFT_691808 [Bisporella sp. PMI_857]|nr:hypothetical protein B0O99DRAFT_691808 [Bisporella sp. PMI_857]